MQRHPKAGLHYRQLGNPVRLVCFADAAFKAIPEESSGLALRGTAILLVGQGSETPASADDSHGCHLLEFTTRRQRRVQRSTFSAELNSLVDSLESILLVQVGLHQAMTGETPEFTTLESGGLTPRVDMAIDARAVFDALTAQDAAETSESSLKLHVLAFRDRLYRGVCSVLWWTDTNK